MKELKIIFVLVFLALLFTVVNAKEIEFKQCNSNNKVKVLVPDFEWNYNNISINYPEITLEQYNKGDYINLDESYCNEKGKNYCDSMQLLQSLLKRMTKIILKENTVDVKGFTPRFSNPDIEALRSFKAKLTKDAINQNILNDLKKELEEKVLKPRILSTEEEQALRKSLSLLPEIIEFIKNNNEAGIYNIVFQLKFPKIGIQGFPELNIPEKGLYIVVFKSEQTWISTSPYGEFRGPGKPRKNINDKLINPGLLYLFKDGKLLPNYPIKVSTGLRPGNKRVQGDCATPEGEFNIVPELIKDPVKEFGSAGYNYGDRIIKLDVKEASINAWKQRKYYYTSEKNCWARKPVDFFKITSTNEIYKIEDNERIYVDDKGIYYKKKGNKENALPEPTLAEIETDSGLVNKIARYYGIWIHGIRNKEKVPNSLKVQAEIDEKEIKAGAPGSAGCVTLNNDELIKLYDEIEKEIKAKKQVKVYIVPSKLKGSWPEFTYYSDARRNLNDLKSLIEEKQKNKDFDLGIKVFVDLIKKFKESPENYLLNLSIDDGLNTENRTAYGSSADKVIPITKENKLFTGENAFIKFNVIDFDKKDKQAILSIKKTKKENEFIISFKPKSTAEFITPKAGLQYPEVKVINDLFEGNNNSFGKEIKEFTCVELKENELRFKWDEKKINEKLKPINIVFVAVNQSNGKNFEKQVKEHSMYLAEKAGIDWEKQVNLQISPINCYVDELGLGKNDIIVRLNKLKKMISSELPEIPENQVQLIDNAITKINKSTSLKEIESTITPIKFLVMKADLMNKTTELFELIEEIEPWKFTLSPITVWRNKWWYWQGEKSLKLIEADKKIAKAKTKTELQSALAEIIKISEDNEITRFAAQNNKLSELKLIKEELILMAKNVLNSNNAIGMIYKSSNFDKIENSTKAFQNRITSIKIAGKTYSTLSTQASLIQLQDCMKKLTEGKKISFNPEKDYVIGLTNVFSGIKDYDNVPALFSSNNKRMLIVNSNDIENYNKENTSKGILLMNLYSMNNKINSKELSKALNNAMNKKELFRSILFYEPDLK